MNPLFPLDDQISENILFRREGPAAWRPVFAEPLRGCVVRSNNHREGLRHDAAAMAARLAPKL